MTILCNATKPSFTDADTIKQFIGYWNSGDFYGEPLRMLTLEDCTAENGYDAEDVGELNELEIGGTWMSEAFGESHTITRVQNKEI